MAFHCFSSHPFSPSRVWMYDHVVYTWMMLSLINFVVPWETSYYQWGMGHDCRLKFSNIEKSCFCDDLTQPTRIFFLRTFESHPQTHIGSRGVLWKTEIWVELWANHEKGLLAWLIALFTHNWKFFFFLSRISIISPVSSLLGHVFSLFKIVFAWGLVNDLHLHLQSRNSRVVTASVEMNLGGMSVIYFVPAVMLYLF